jgi:hypothetical protein
MESSADIPQDRGFSTLIPLAHNLSTFEKLVEYPTVRRRDVFLVADSHFSSVIFCASTVQLVSRDIEITSQDYLFAHLVKVTYPNVQSGNERATKVVSETIAVGGTVYSEQNESREFENNTTTFGIECSRIHAKFNDLRV